MIRSIIVATSVSLLAACGIQPARSNTSLASVPEDGAKDEDGAATLAQLRKEKEEQAAKLASLDVEIAWLELKVEGLPKYYKADNYKVKPRPMPLPRKAEATEDSGTWQPFKVNDGKYGPVEIEKRPSKVRIFSDVLEINQDDNFSRFVAYAEGGHSGEQLAAKFEKAGVPVELYDLNFEDFDGQNRDWYQSYQTHQYYASLETVAADLDRRALVVVQSAQGTYQNLGYALLYFAKDSKTPKLFPINADLSNYFSKFLPAKRFWSAPTGYSTNYRNQLVAVHRRIEQFDPAYIHRIVTGK